MSTLSFLRNASSMCPGFCFDVGAILTSVGGSLLSSALSSKNSQSAANTQSQSADAAIQEQKREFDLNQTNQKPFLQTGTAANSKLAELLGLSVPSSTAATPGSGAIPAGAQAYTPGNKSITQYGFDPNSTYYRTSLTGGTFQNDQGGIYYKVDSNGNVTSATNQPGSADFNWAPVASTSDASSQPSDFGSLAKPFTASDFTQDPGYQFRLQQGQQAIDRSAAAKGGLLGGAAVKASDAYNSGQAAQEYQSAYDRYNTNQTNLYNKLAGISGTGQIAANNLGTSGQQTANSISDLLTQQGNVNAAGQVGSANAWSTGLGQIGQTLSNSGSNLSNFFSSPSSSGNGLFYSGGASAGPITWN